MGVTIKDVAQLAGVAPSTVSRVIADNPSISEPTKEKVRKAMIKLRYYPNVNARNLVSKHSNTIGLVLPTASDAFYHNPFFPAVLRGINDVASREGYSILLTTGHSIEERQNHIERMVFGKQVDGLIFLYSTSNDPIMKFAIETKFPFVVIGTPNLHQVNYVDNDNYQAAFEATEWLLSQDFGKLAYIGGDLSQPFIKFRYQGYIDALTKHGINKEIQASYNKKVYTPKDGYELGVRFSNERKYDAVIIADELVARGFKQGMFTIGNYMTTALTFKSYPLDEEYREQTQPYVNLKSQHLGERAVEILFEILETKESHQQGNKRFIQEVISGELIP